MTITKRCPKCKQTLPASAFAEHRKAKDGKQSRCRTCVSNLYHKQKAELIAGGVLAGGETFIGDPCSKCGGVERYISNRRCIPCQKATAKAIRKANPERTRAKKKAWVKANPERKKEYDKEQRKRHPERIKAYELKRFYGISLETYNEMLAEQCNRCASCFRPFLPGRGTCAQVDHCHETGRVRGLLCTNCNLALGWLEDDTQILRLLSQYLERSQMEILAEISVRVSRIEKKIYEN
jgi:hypothetical protein